MTHDRPRKAQFAIEQTCTKHGSQFLPDSMPVRIPSYSRPVAAGSSTSVILGFKGAFAAACAASISRCSWSQSIELGGSASRRVGPANLVATAGDARTDEATGAADRSTIRST